MLKILNKISLIFSPKALLSVVPTVVLAVKFISLVFRDIFEPFNEFYSKQGFMF